MRKIGQFIGFLIRWVIFTAVYYLFTSLIYFAINLFMKGVQPALETEYAFLIIATLLGLHGANESYKVDEKLTQKIK